MKLKNNLITSVIMFLPALIMAQSPLSGFMKNKGEGAAVVTYSSENYDKVFLVPSEIDGVPVFNDVEVQSVSLYAEYGITDKLNVIVNLPYIKAEGNASEQVLANNGFENTRKGLQDLKLYLKYDLKSFDFANSRLNFMGALGLETPLGDYAVDEGLQSIIAIGNRSTTVNATGIFMYKLNSGFFTTGQVGYSVKSNDVPNALLSEFKLGYAASKFYLDAFIANQLSDKDGVDILGQGFTGFFPATRVNYTRVGVNAYVPLAGGFGLTGGANSYIEGRNLGKSSGYYGGVAFSF